MAGELRPGQKLFEADLCRELQVSRPSVREALRALETERLIELIPNRGPSVARLGAKEIEEIHEVWAMLTGEFVYRFANHVTVNDISELTGILDRVKACLLTDDPLKQLRVTNELFGYIIQRSRNTVLTELVRTLVSRINFLRTQSLTLDRWRVLCSREIEEIVEAIREHNPTAAREAVRRHIASACEAAMKVVESADRGAQGARGSNATEDHSRKRGRPAK